MEPFDSLESEVRGYIRAFPTIFKTAQNARMTDEDGKEYIDLFAGAGVMNYGHNNPTLKQAVIEYLQEDGVVHGLDMGTSAKARFLETFAKTILAPRGMSYKVQFPGPTGTNAVEAALKLARKITGRHNVISFTNGFHGMTLGALSVTGNAGKRESARISLPSARSMPYSDFLDSPEEGLKVLERFLSEGASGMDKPAAFIVETVQGEGGIRPADFEWLKGIARLAKEHGILLIVDDIQMGCGRTGPFFSFEPAGIQPDIVVMSKAIGAMGLPLAIVLMKPEHDIWGPGEHNGTFRGHNLAFVAATKAIETFWADDKFQKEAEAKGKMVAERMQKIAKAHKDKGVTTRGRGMVHGVVCQPADMGGEICREMFKRGVIMETAGFHDEVAKLMPPLTIDKADLEKGLDLLEEVVAEVAERHGRAA